MFRNASLRQAITAAEQHVTPESRKVAAIIDNLEARGATLDSYTGNAIERRA